MPRCRFKTGCRLDCVVASAIPGEDCGNLEASRKANSLPKYASLGCHSCIRWRRVVLAGVPTLIKLVFKSETIADDSDLPESVGKFAAAPAYRIVRCRRAAASCHKSGPGRIISLGSAEHIAQRSWRKQRAQYHSGVRSPSGPEWIGYVLEAAISRPPFCANAGSTTVTMCVAARHGPN
jgi:hypothetical protein